MATVFEEISAAVGQPIPTTVPTDEQVFLLALSTSMTKLTDPQWDALSKSSQDWYNAAAAATNEKKEIPTIPGYQIGLSVVTDAAPISQDTPAPAATPVATAEPPATNGATTPKRGVMHRMREITLGNPAIKPEDLKTQLEGEGWGKVSLDSSYLCVSEVKNVLKAIKSTGYVIIKDPVKG